ncbi:MAG: hypothetical protein KGQ94_11180, partial [Alphaproteobacteria bacterium]|nr:hypothetical protein [Alphaproteobacteria bacterium]
AADPTGTWKLRPADFATLGRMLAAFGRPTAFIQEGGYRTRTLGQNAAALFSAVLKNATASPTAPPQRRTAAR